MVSQKRSSSVSLSDLLGTRKRRSKHGNVKTTIGSEKYDSKREASRHQSLLLEQRAGSIAGLRRQVRYMLIPSQRRADGKAERPVTYIADFVYERDGATIVEDSKGMRTRDYIMKRKMMLFFHNVSIIET